MKVSGNRVEKVGRGVPAEPRPTLVKRKPLGHEAPAWVPDGSIYFITICTAERGDQLTRHGHGLIDSIRHLHEQGKWFVHLWVVMPDHVHGLISIPLNTRLDTRISAWKSFVARKFGIKWQARFFDHRVRSGESLDEKFHYIA